ncbi:MAG: hypothetical protein FWC78_07395 [Defluviitaleaceae bacterium]|nr:hypothetical protein [Defluviitaleaceae bacterium]
MKVGAQIYVRGSIEAVEFYREAFNASLGFYEYFADGTPEDGYHHASIMVGDTEILAVCENECYTSNVVGHPVMQFNCSLGTKEAVLQAYKVLSKEAIKNENPNGPIGVPWDENEQYFSIIDKYNIWWGIGISL